MNKGRLEAFSDGVIAIIITIMVLELKVPHGGTFQDLMPLFPVLMSYILSFVYIAIYWNNHHHLLHAAKKVNGKVLWANMHLLFWLSLVPFTTAWMGDNHFTSQTVAIYGFILLMAGVAYAILENMLIKANGENSIIAKAFSKSRFKDISAPILYILAIPLAFVSPWISGALYVLVALIWLIPDRRMEKIIESIE